MTYSYALLGISEAAYLEIKERLTVAGYFHAMIPNPDAPASPRLNMYGIALVPEARPAIEVETCKGRFLINADFNGVLDPD